MSPPTSEYISGLTTTAESYNEAVELLKRLDVDPSSYGNLLLPLINAKLPNELRLLISRKCENEVWLLFNLLKHLKIEIEAKERSVSLGHFYTERVESKRDNRFTTCVLLTSEESRLLCALP